MVRTGFQRPTSALRLRRNVRIEFERARAGRVEEAARQTSVAVERVRRAGFVARRAADVLVRDLSSARRADQSYAKERGLLGRVQHVAAREDVVLRQRRDLKRRRMRCRPLHVYSTDPRRPQGDLFDRD